MQMMRAAVIAEAAQRASTRSIDAAASACTSGNAATKRSEIRDDRRDLRLLQHDLGEPDPVGVARVLPRQVAPAVRRAARRSPVGRNRAEPRDLGRCAPGATIDLRISNDITPSFPRARDDGASSWRGRSTSTRCGAHSGASASRAAASPSPRPRTADTWRSALRACGARRGCRSGPIAPMRRSRVHRAPWGSSDTRRPTRAAK